MNVIDRQTHIKHNNTAKVMYKYGQKPKVRGKREHIERRSHDKMLHTN